MSGRVLVGGLVAVVVVGFFSPAAGAVLLGLLALGFFLLRPPEGDATPGRENPAGMLALEGRVGRLERGLSELRLLVAGSPVAGAPRPAPAPAAPPGPQPPARPARPETRPPRRRPRGPSPRARGPRSTSRSSSARSGSPGPAAS